MQETVTITKTITTELEVTVYEDEEDLSTLGIVDFDAAGHPFCYAPNGKPVRLNYVRTRTWREGSWTEDKWYGSLWEAEEDVPEIRNQNLSNLLGKKEKE